MLDNIIEIFLELILDGVIEAAGSKKVPMPIRIALGAVLSILVLGLFALLLFVGIHAGSGMLIVLSVVVLAAAVIWIGSKVKAFRSRR